MPTQANPLAALSRNTVETAARLTRISMDSAERVIALQLDFARTTLDQATRTARAAAGARDVQELLSVRTRSAENTLEKLMGYSRGLYEVASDAQGELSRIAEERMASYQRSVVEAVEQASKAAPAGSDVALAAVKSTVAATTAAFDSFNKAAKHVASYADAGVKAAGHSKSRK